MPYSLNYIICPGCPKNPLASVLSCYITSAKNQFQFATSKLEQTLKYFIRRKIEHLPHSHNPKSEEPEEEVDDEDQELEAAVAARQPHLQNLQNINTGISLLNFPKSIPVFSTLSSNEFLSGSVSDPDPDWIRIQGSSGSGSGFGIRIQGLKKRSKM